MRRQKKGKTIIMAKGDKESDRDTGMLKAIVMNAFQVTV